MFSLVFVQRGKIARHERKPAHPPAPSVPLACKLWPESGMEETWHSSFQHPCSLTQCDKKAAQWYSVFLEEQMHNAWRIVYNSMWEPPLGDKHYIRWERGRKEQRMCNKGCECKGVGKCIRASALGVPHVQVSALPLAVSSCALPPSLEAEEDSCAHSASGCLHVLSCFPG